MSSMMLGATYLGGAYFFLVVVRSRQWRHVWLGFLPITAFAGTLGVATLLHWDLFPHDRLGFQLWAVLYFGVPVVLTIAGVLLFLVPDLMLALWPWTLSPLTARVMAAMYILPGLVG